MRTYMKRRVLGILMLLALASASCWAQKAAVKTNLIYDATATVNLGAEFALAPKWTLDLSANYNGWDIKSDKKWKHWMAQPEARYWFCNKFMGHFIGIHAHGGQFNMGGLDLDFKFLGTNYRNLRDHRYEGWFAGGGIAYGYAWTLGKHWNMEAELGIGYSYTDFDKYACEKCGKKVESNANHHYFGITKAALSLVYVF